MIVIESRQAELLGPVRQVKALYVIFFNAAQCFLAHCLAVPDRKQSHRKEAVARPLLGIAAIVIIDLDEDFGEFLVHPVQQADRRRCETVGITNLGVNAQIVHEFQALVDIVSCGMNLIHPRNTEPAQTLIAILLDDTGAGGCDQLFTDEPVVHHTFAFHVRRTPLHSFGQTRAPQIPLFREVGIHVDNFDPFGQFACSMEIRSLYSRASIGERTDQPTADLGFVNTKFGPKAEFRVILCHNLFPSLHLRSIKPGRPEHQVP